MRNLQMAAAIGLSLLLLTSCDRPQNITPTPVRQAAIQVPPAFEDEYAAVVAKCGKPVHVVNKKAPVLPSDGSRWKMIDVFYPRVDIEFMQGSTEPWAMVGAFYIKHDDTLTRAELDTAMPCIRDVTFGNQFVQ